MNRGRERKTIFHSEVYNQAFLATLTEAAGPFHAYQVTRQKDAFLCAALGTRINRMAAKLTVLAYGRQDNSQRTLCRWW